MNPILTPVAVIFVLVAALTGCSTKAKHTLSYNLTEPLRVAVLPFVLRKSDGTFSEEEGRLYIDGFGIHASKSEETPTQIMRRFTFANLRKTGLSIVSPLLIDIDLPHHGFNKADGALDLRKLYNTLPQEICTKFLTCDAVLYGFVTSWDRSYYGLQSVATVGIEYKLLSSHNGKELFSSIVTDASSRGISKIPTGFSDLLIEPIKGLSRDVIDTLAESVVHKALSPIFLSKRVATLDEPPPAIFASAHDGKFTKLTTTSPLTVVAYGSQQKEAFFRIGDSGIEVPMVERLPGHYYGEFLPIENIRFNHQPIIVGLKDLFGRITEQTVPNAEISY